MLHNVQRKAAATLEQRRLEVDRPRGRGVARTLSYKVNALIAIAPTVVKDTHIVALKLHISSTYTINQLKVAANF